MTRCIAVCRVSYIWAAYHRCTLLFMIAKVPPFDPGTGPPGYLYMAVADHMAARIEAGELPPGARLPGERDLAAEYHCALGTARRAVEELRHRGLVITLPAKGTFVAGR
jgi:GntR family transcriptional regulator